MAEGGSVAEQNEPKMENKSDDDNDEVEDEVENKSDDDNQNDEAEEEEEDPEEIIEDDQEMDDVVPSNDGVQKVSITLIFFSPCLDYENTFHQLHANSYLELHVFRFFVRTLDLIVSILIRGLCSACPFEIGG